MGVGMAPKRTGSAGGAVREIAASIAFHGRISEERDRRGEARGETPSESGRGKSRLILAALTPSTPLSASSRQPAGAEAFASNGRLWDAAGRARSRRLNDLSLYTHLQGAVHHNDELMSARAASADRGVRGGR